MPPHDDSNHLSAGGEFAIEATEMVRAWRLEALYYNTARRLLHREGV